jgi:hypothetical protein
VRPLKNSKDLAAISEESPKRGRPSKTSKDLSSNLSKTSKELAAISEETLPHVRALKTSKDLVEFNIAGIDEYHALEDHVSRRSRSLGSSKTPSVAHSRQLSHPSRSSTALLSKAVDSRETTKLPVATLARPGTKESEWKPKTKRAATMGEEAMRIAREKIKKHVQDERIESLKNRGIITEYVLQNEATIRSLGLKLFELHQRAQAAGASETDIELAIKDAFDPITALIKFIVEKEKEITPSLEDQAADYRFVMRDKLRKTQSMGNILSPESFDEVEIKQAQKDDRLPGGFRTGDVVTTSGGHDQDGPWRDSGGVGVILGTSIHGLGCVDVLFDRTGDIEKIKGKNLTRYVCEESEAASIRGRSKGAMDAKLLPALRGRGVGSGVPNGFVKGVSIFDRQTQRIAF